MDTSSPEQIAVYAVLVLALMLLEQYPMIAVFVIFGLIAAGLGIGLIATAIAPVGYQDEIGFHFGQQKRAEVAEFPCGAPQPQWV